MQPVFEYENIMLYQENCMALMDHLIKKSPHGMFDMIFADPPYFLSNGGITCHAGQMVRVDKGDWDKSHGASENFQFNMDWISKSQQLLNPNGTMWVSGTHHVIYSVGHAMQLLGMKVLNNITWEKPNPPPNLSCRYFTHSTETLIWVAKNAKSKHTFNYAFAKAQNDGKQMKSVWRMNSPNRLEKIHGKHPTQKPVSLLDRIILVSTKENDLIFDPFSGSSTTGVSAIMNNRRFLGCEIVQEFINLSEARLSDALLSQQQRHLEAAQ